MNYRKIVFTVIIVLLIAMSGIGPARAAEKTYKVGVLIWQVNPVFIDEMTKLGYVEGKNISYVVISFANVAKEGGYNAVRDKGIEAALAAKVDAIAINTAADAAAVRSAVGNIPIVFARSEDPVGVGSVKSLVKPGVPATGIMSNRPDERRLQLLLEIKPTTKKVYYIYTTTYSEWKGSLKLAQDAAKLLGIELLPVAISDTKLTDEPLDNMPADVDWIFFTPGVNLTEASAKKLAEVSIAHHIAVSTFNDVDLRSFVLSYGMSMVDTSRQAARIMDRILRGGNPADMPIESGEHFLILNLEAAKAINLTIPESILRQASRILRPGDFDATATPAK